MTWLLFRKKNFKLNVNGWIQHKLNGHVSHFKWTVVGIFKPCLGSCWIKGSKLGHFSSKSQLCACKNMLFFSFSWNFRLNKALFCLWAKTLGHVWTKIFLHWSKYNGLKLMLLSVKINVDERPLKLFTTFNLLVDSVCWSSFDSSFFITNSQRAIPFDTRAVRSCCFCFSTLL